MKKLVLASLIAAALGVGGGAQAMSLGNWLQAKPVATQPVVNVQAAPAEVQIQQLEETIRQLTGRIEDLNYQLLQMQEDMRKTQEDNEFRFQQLEKKSGAKKASADDIPADGSTQEAADAAASTSASDTDTAAVDAASDVASTDAPTDQIASIVESNGGNTVADETITNQASATDETLASQAPSQEMANIQPGTLGSLIFNGDGQLQDTTRNPADNSAETLPGVNTGISATNETEQASIAPDAASPAAAAPTDSEGVYQVAYKHILSGDYADAEKGFVAYIDQFPEGEKVPDASFWLGEAQYSQGRFNDAAKTFLNAYKTYGQSPKAPEMLLKLGMSLAALDNKDTACATFREIPKRFPKASKTVISKVATEEKRLSCSPA